MKINALTESALAQLVGINQSSVSRALNRDPPTWTPSLRRIFSYAENLPSEAVTVDNEVAREALARAAAGAWDGTSKGLHSLLRLLSVLREFRDVAVPQRSPGPSVKE